MADDKLKINIDSSDIERLNKQYDEYIKSLKTAAKKVKAVSREQYVLANLMKESKASANEVTMAMNKMVNKMSKAQKQIGKLRDVNVTLTNDNKKLVSTIEKQERRINALTKAVDKLKNAKDKASKSTKKGSKATKEETEEQKKANEAKEQAIKTTKDFSKALSSALGFVWNSIRSLFEYGKALLKLVKKYDALDFSLKTVIRETHNLTFAIGFLADITMRYGLDIQKTTKAFIK